MAAKITFVAALNHRVSFRTPEESGDHIAFMASSDKAFEVEDVYRHLSDGSWLEALTLLTSLGDELAREKHLRRASEVFLDEFFRADTEAGPEESTVLEKLILLDASGRIDLTQARREQVVLRLVSMHESEPELAASFARFLPDHPECRSVLESAGPARRERKTAAGAPISVERVGREMEDGHGQHTSVIDSAASCDERGESVSGTCGGRGGRSLFRSVAERNFYEAVVRVFPAYFVVPNAAMHAVVDFDVIQQDLTSREKDYFFRALLDIVVIDQANDHVPAFVFELDSQLHDDDKQRERDRMKDRMLSLAGLSTYRIRAADARMLPERFIPLLRRIIGSK